MTNIRQLMKQAQQMQERMQRELAEMVVEASVGGGMVTVKMSGHKQLVAVKIDPEVMDPEDPSCSRTWSSPRSTRRRRKVDEEMQGEDGQHASGMPDLLLSPS